MTGAPFFYSEQLLGYNMGVHHPMKPIRLKLTEDLIAAYGLFETTLQKVEPLPADREEVAETHSRDFLDALSALDGGEETARARRFGLGTGDNPIFPGIYSQSLLYTGASIAAAQAVMDGSPIAFNVAGGLHHAHYDRAAGFCVLNDCAVAIRRLKQKYKRIAYVDIDVHHGDGVQELFYEDPLVLTLSLHESGRSLYPGTGFTHEIGKGAGEGFSVNLPFDPDTSDTIWLSAWREAALPLLMRFDPEVILLQMGTDAHRLDPLAHLALTAQGWLEAVQDVQAMGRPIVAVGGGGYNMTTVPRMWTLAVAALCHVTLPDVTPAHFSDHKRSPTLTDPIPWEIKRDDRNRAEAFASQSVREIKQLLFPRYQLS